MYIDIQYIIVTTINNPRWAAVVVILSTPQFNVLNVVVAVTLFSCFILLQPLFIVERYSRIGSMTNFS